MNVYSGGHSVPLLVQQVAVTICFYKADLNSVLCASLLTPTAPSQCHPLPLCAEMWSSQIFPSSVLTPLDPCPGQQARPMELLTDASCSRRLSTSRWAASARWGGEEGSK